MRKPKLNNNAQKWVKALQSGKYHQGKEKLTTIRKSGEFDCCLGVACKLFMKENPNKLTRTITGNTVWYGNKNTKDFQMLPSVVQAWLGLESDIGDFDGDYCLAGLNDEGKKFSVIAKVIQAKPKGLFKRGR